jgi:hypothetical protein
MKAKAKVPTSKQKIASQLNWDKMQLVSAVGHLKLLIAKYSMDAGGSALDIAFLEGAIRQGMHQVAQMNEIKGDYTTQVPYEESRMFKRNTKQFVESRKIEGNQS